MTPTTPAEYERWQFERKLLEDLLARVEQAERAILDSLHCPTDPAAVFDVLEGKQPAPWPARTAARARVRARHAMYTLALVAQVRSEIGLGRENALAAARAALLAGVHAGDAATHAVLAAQVQQDRRAGGRTRGAQKSRDARRHDETIARWERRWRESDELKDQFGDRSPVSCITHKTKLGARTIQRALKRLRTRQ